MLPGKTDHKGPSLSGLSSKKLLYPFALITCFVLFLTSCQKETDEDAGVEALEQTNVAYGSDPAQVMDLYLPANRDGESTKVIILVHGGAWADGDKNDFTGFVPELQQRLPGYAVFNLNYRLVDNGTNQFPAQENDIKKAVEFIYSHRVEYKISDKFVYLGASAGAHLALLQAYKYNTPVTAKAVVSFYGPTDLIELYNSNIIAASFLAEVTGTTPVNDASIYEQSSPSQFVDADDPPTILLQGGLDPIVPPSQAELLKTLLTTAAVPNQYVFYPNEGHVWVGPNLEDSFDKIAAFLLQYVN